MSARSRIVAVAATHCLVMMSACFEPTILVGRHVPQAEARLQPASVGCMVTGCRNEICADVVRSSNCEPQASDGCFATALCEKQSNGRCAFTSSAELSECIELNTPTTCEEAGAECLQQVDRNCRDGDWLDIARFTCGERLGEGCCKHTRVLSSCEQLGGTCLRTTRHACTFGQWDFTRSCTNRADSCCAPPP